MAQSPHPYLGGPWAFYAWWGRLNPFAPKATKTPPPTNYPDQPTREKTGLGAEPQHIKPANQTTPQLSINQTKNAKANPTTANQLRHLKNSRKNGAWGKASTYKANQSNQFVTFEKLAKSPKFAKVTLKTSTANKPKTKQEIQSRHQSAAAKKAAVKGLKRSSKKSSSKKGKSTKPTPNLTNLSTFQQFYKIPKKWGFALD